MAGLNILLILFTLFSTSKANNWTPQEFDFIIVGAGSAGSVVANRLSEDPNILVLLLEAGGEPPDVEKIPLLAGDLWGSEFDWKLKIESQKKACLSMIDKGSPWPRGKLLGGSSSINAMNYLRGNKNDYDHWAALGNEGWSYDDILPYFLKLEDYRVPHSKYDEKYHSRNGPVTVSRPFYRTPLADAFMEAGMEMGYHETDHNGGTQTGFMIPVFNIKDGVRCGTYEAYLEPALHRQNLHIVTEAFVTKVLIANKEATGVLFEKDGTTWSVKAKKEVILSAGTPLTPQILMLSGIGPKEILDKFQIPEIIDLPGVGQNLQDHVFVNGLYFTLEEPVAINLQRDINEDSWRQFKEKGIGILTVPVAVEGIAFVNSRFANTKIDHPDLELLFLSTQGYSSGIPPEVYNKAFCPPDSRDYFSIYPLIQRPKSRGFMTLRSANPHDQPIYDPRYLSEEEDVKVLIDAVKISLNLTKTKAFQRYGAKYHTRAFPGCESHKLHSDKYWECCTRHYTKGLFHIVGTCKMGPKTDRMAVVDFKLRVHGLKRLRVVDASIMPTIITGHTNVPAIMIGEKAADMIKEDWNLKKHDEL